MSPSAALKAARTILEDFKPVEVKRLDRIAKAMRPVVDGSQVTLPAGTPQQMRDLAMKSATNYLPLILDSLVQSMFVEGYRQARSSDNAAPWAIWQANGMDARQTGVYRAALQYGVSYGVTLPGELAGKPVPVMRGVSPRQMTALYGDATNDEWPILALWDDGSDIVRLLDEEQVYYFGREQGAQIAKTASTVLRTFTGAGNTSLTYLEAKAHDLGVTPAVRFRDRMLLDGEEQLGIIEPLISIQQRLDETVFGLLVAQYFQAFKQRYIIGWLPEDDAATLKTKASELWTFEDEHVEVGQLDQADLGPYVEAKEAAVKDMAAISQVPPQQLAVGAVANMSADGLAALEAGKDRKVSEVETSLGESDEQWLRLSAHAAGDEESAADTASQVRWRDQTARSLAQTVDALGKMAQMLLIPPQALWERVPGVTDQDLAAWKEMAKSSDTLGQLTALLDRQAAGSPVSPPVSGG